MLDPNIQGPETTSCKAFMSEFTPFKAVVISDIMGTAWMLWGS